MYTKKRVGSPFTRAPRASSIHVFIQRNYTCVLDIRFANQNRRAFWNILTFVMPRLNNEDRARALGMLECGQTQDNVARRFNVARSTITRLVQRVNVTGSLSDRPRPGAPRVTSVRQDTHIRLRHLRDRYVTAESSASLVMGNRGRTISRSTVRNRLRERGISCRRPYCGPVLKQRHRIERQRWAINNRGRRWRNVVFSDESRFNLSLADGRVRIYRRQYERFADNCVLEHNRFGGGGVMVWAAINHTFEPELVIVNGNLTARQYIDQILQPSVVWRCFTNVQD